MFQQTIQDVLALTEASGRAEDVLETLRVRISAFESFERAELLARTQAGLRRFPAGEGLGEAGPKAMDALGDEPTLRIDTTADMKSRGISSEPGLTSLLVLRIGAPRSGPAAIVLSHSRAWSFAGAPLSRIRTIGQVALRLLLSEGSATPAADEVARVQTEVARLRTQVASLEQEIAGLRSERGRKR
jgi:hypothetical protein